MSTSPVFILSEAQEDLLEDLPTKVLIEELESRTWLPNDFNTLLDLLRENYKMLALPPSALLPFVNIETLDHQLKMELLLEAMERFTLHQLQNILK